MNRYGSDLVVDCLSQLGIRYVASNPGASFRGLHDSITHSSTVSMIETLNEGTAVSVAHGYAKAAGSSMAVALHDLVGLQAASMAVFNAWVDMVPILLLGGSGPANHPDRRPWIDWIHNAKPQSLVVRDYVKWDDQPVSAVAIPESIARAHYLSTLAPSGPTYLALDISVQNEQVSGDTTVLPLPNRRSRLSIDPSLLEDVARAVSQASRPLIVADYTGRTQRSFRLLSDLATTLSAPVIDLGSTLNIPTNHSCDVTLVGNAVLKAADLILALDVRDIAWALNTIRGTSGPNTTPLETPIIAVGLNDLMKASFVDLERFDYVDIRIVAETEAVLEAINASMEGFEPKAETREWLTECRVAQEAARRRLPPKGGFTTEHVISDSAHALGGIQIQVSQLGPGSAQKYAWLRRYWDLEDYGSFLGRSGGGGIGYGVGASIGAALAQANTDRIVVDFQPDGDALHSISGLWTAAHHSVPALFIVLNNRGYERERHHQRQTAVERGRSTDRISIGTDIRDPEISFTALAEAQGVRAFGPATSRASFRQALADAAAIVVDHGTPALVDAVVT